MQEIKTYNTDEELKTIIFYLSNKEKEFVRHIAKRLGLNLSGFIRLAILRRAREEKIILNQNQKLVEVQG